jgi:YVTN family beta-propeller protein
MKHLRMVLGGLLLGVGATSACAQTGGMLAVVNQGEHNVSLVDVGAGKIVATVSVGVNGHEIAISPAGDKLYVPIYSNVGVGKPGTAGRTIDVIDTKTWKLEPAIDLGRELRPHKDIFGPDGMLYVSGELANAIEIVDVKQGKVVGEVPTGQPESHLFAITADGKRAYTANVGPGSVSVLDLANRKVVKVIPLSKHVQRMAISNDGHWAFTSDWDQPRVAVIDTGSNSLSRWVTTGGIPYVTQPTPDGKSLLVGETSADGKGLLEMIDLTTWKVTRQLAAPARPNFFLLHNGLIYMDFPTTGDIKVLDPEKMAFVREFKLTPGIDGMAWVRSAR